jgi:serine/threonine protein kinase
MAPEAISGGIYSTASDVWSVGAVLYTLVTGGEVPSQFKPLSSPTSLDRKVLQNFGPSEAAQALLCSLLRANPDERLTSASAFWKCQDWEEFAISTAAGVDELELNECMSRDADVLKGISSSTITALTEEGQIMYNDRCSEESSKIITNGFSELTVDTKTHSQILKPNSDMDADFIIFSDFNEKCDDLELPRKAKQLRTSSNKSNDVENTLRSLPCAGKLHNSRDESVARNHRSCKENNGPYSTCVCKHERARMCPQKGAPASANAKGGSHQCQLIR